MHPDLPFAVAKAHQRDLSMHAHEARRAAELQRSDRGRFHLPRIEFSRRVGAVRIRIAHT
jgi:hypothetical protein